MSRCILTFLITILFSNLIYALDLSEESIWEQLEINPGSFRLIGQGQSECLEGELKLIKLQDNKYTLKLGAHALITNIGVDSAIFEERDCTRVVNTKLARKKITSKIQHRCSDSNREFELKLDVVSNDQFTYQNKILDDENPYSVECTLERER